ncbi:DUF6221 family protein [Streptomyces lateritius]|uniref:DUF6221 family protein n=1 Tax=Streptomyces lateritius TaxID=67313 RepID=UPI001C8C7957|nr:DUF6221 family protein [Streptomyces lateritius]MBX9425412.1 hypothetical protein [Streptomyces lateritius]
MDDLIAFLRARLDEDERTARGVLWDGSGNTLKWDLPFSATVQVGSEVFTTDDSAVADHIARHDPARVLAEVDAKRRALEQFEYWNQRMAQEVLHPPRYPQPGLDLGLLLDALNPILMDFARPYVDHPDFKAWWAPSPSEEE